MAQRPHKVLHNAGSLLDRLTEPVESSAEATLSTARLRDGLRRDLEGVLNTRRRFLSWPDELEELDASLLSYGLSDFTNAPIKSDAFRRDFISEVELLIRKLEPRITQFTVTILDNKDETDRILRFRIVGLVDIAGERRQVSFDSHVDPIFCGVVVRE